MVRVRCPSCGHVWDYKGSRKYTTCPKCRTTLSVRKNIATLPTERDLVRYCIAVFSALSNGQKYDLDVMIHYLINVYKALYNEDPPELKDVKEIERLIIRSSEEYSTYEIERNTREEEEEE